MEQPERAYDLFISYADADRAWVDGYLLDALTQAGARVHTEAAFALGVPRLLEFERAVQHSQRTLLILSPAYLAESSGQFANLLAQTYGLETATWPVIPLILHPVELPPRLAMLTALDSTDPGAWASVVERLCVELQRPVPGPPPRPPCPYPGMVAFSEADSDRFYGRDEEVQALLERLRLHPFVTVIGPSGSGKSSLVYAGLVPALRGSGLFGPGQWLVRAVRPGERPMEALAVALEGDLVDPEQAVAELLATRPDARRLLLIVDQFEETFALSGPEAEPFQAALLKLARVPNCFLALTARADFYADLMACPLWCEIQAHRAEVLPMDENGLRQAIIRPAEGMGVFVETALVERLVADAAGEPGILPLVQETLVLLWEHVERRYLPLRAYEALILPRRAYGPSTRPLVAGQEPRTGLQVAIARRADAALAGLSPAAQAVARRVFLRLVQFGEGRADTRRQQRVEQLRASGDDWALFEGALFQLADSRLLTLSGEEGAGGRVADIAHEALIDGWPTLREWLGERRGAEQIRRRLEAKAAEWVRLGRGSGGLLDEVELLEAKRWLDSPDAQELGGVSEDLRDLAQGSRTAIEQAEREKEAARQRELEQQRALAQEAEARRQAEEQRAREAEAREREQARSARRLRMLAAGLAIVFVLAVGAAVVAGVSQQQATQAEQTAVAERATALAAATQEAVAKEAAEAERKRAEAESTRAIKAEQTAEAERDRAEEEAQIAFSRQLAAQALNELGSNNPDLALLLAIEAVRTDETLEAIDALREIMAAPKLTRLRLAGHENAVRQACWNNAEDRILTFSWDNTARIWDAETGDELFALEHEDPVNSAVWSADDRWILTASDDHKARVWDAETGEAHLVLEGQEGWVTDAVWNEDESRILTASDDDTARVWDAKTGKILFVLSGHTDAVWHASWSHDESRILTTSSDNTARVWDVNTGDELFELEHGSWVSSAAWNADDSRILTASGDKTARVWDANTGAESLRLEGHEDQIRQAIWNADESRILTVSDDKTARVWDAETGEILHILSGHTNRVWSGAWNAGESFILTSSWDGTARIWDAKTGELHLPLIGHTAALAQAVWNEAGNQILTSSSDYTVRVWDLGLETKARGELPALSGHTRACKQARWNADESQILTASFDGTARLWNAQTGIEQLVLRGDTSQVTYATWNGDESFILTGHDSGNVYVWNAKTGEKLLTLFGHNERITQARWNADETLILTSSWDRTARIWDTQTGQPLTILSGHSESVLKARWNADESRVLTASEDDTARIWDAQTGQLLTILSGHDGNVGQACWNADESRVLTASQDGTARIWDAQTGQPFTIFSGHGGSVREARWSVDESRILTASEDGTARIWDAETGQERARFSGHSDTVWEAHWNADESRILTASEDGTARQFHTDQDDLLAAACRQTLRNMTPDEWAQTMAGQDYRATCSNLPVE